MSTLDTPTLGNPGADSRTTGVIHDIGYQRYQGPRLGRRHIVVGLYVHAMRTAFGLGRSAKAKIFPWLVVGVVTVIAAVLTAVRAQTGQSLMTYQEFPEALSMLIILFCAVVAPELVSRDLQSGVLPLYFARPLGRSDYALAKLAAFVSATFLMLAGPLTVMFAGAAFSVGKLRLVWSELGDYASGIAYAAIHAVVFGVLALLVAALIKRRAIAAGAIVGVFLLTTPVYGVLSVLPSRRASELAGLTSPVTLVSGIGDWLFNPDDKSGIGDYGPLYTAFAAVAVVLGVLLLLARYRKVASQ